MVDMSMKRSGSHIFGHGRPIPVSAARTSRIELGTGVIDLRVASPVFDEVVTEVAA